MGVRLLAFFGALLILSTISISNGFAFTTQQRLSNPPVQKQRSVQTSLKMRDLSASYWFNVGDRVQVVEDVRKAGTSLKGYQGTVAEVWEKCEVDPTCCCAEKVDCDMAVRVEFARIGTNSTEGNFYFHFNEDELVKVEGEMGAPSKT